MNVIINISITYRIKNLVVFRKVLKKGFLGKNLQTIQDHGALYYMVAQNTERTYGIHKVFRLHRKSRQIQFFCRKRPILLHMCATCSELSSNIGSYSQSANMQFRTPADTPRSNQGSIISLEQKRAVVIF